MRVYYNAYEILRCNPSYTIVLFFGDDLRKLRHINQDLIIQSLVGNQYLIRTEKRSIGNISTAVLRKTWNGGNNDQLINEDNL